MKMLTHLHICRTHIGVSTFEKESEKDLFGASSGPSDQSNGSLGGPLEYKLCNEVLTVARVRHQIVPMVNPKQP
jgi:hypothetical protein